MPKRRTYPTLTLAPREGGTPATHWLYDALRTAVLDGRLRPGARLPATRELADQYGLARGTIVSAFDHLRAEGYIEARVGSGTYVARTLPDQLLKAGRTPSPGRTAARSERRRLSGYAERLRTFPEDLPGPVHAFRANEPALDLFPTTLWAQVAGRRVRRSTQDVLRGCGPLGYRPLREAVADYLTTSRGVHCDAGSVAIVSGVQEALNLVTRVLLEPGDVVALEDPGYVGAALVFDAAGARVTPVPADDAPMGDDAILRATVALARSYAPQQFNGKVCIFVSAEAGLEGVSARIDPRRAWRRVCRDCEAVELPGEHDEMFDPPLVDVFARELGSRLRALSSPSSRRPRFTPS